MHSIDGPDLAVGTADECICFPPFRLDPANEQLWHGECLVSLKPRSLAILQYLLERPAQLVTREELLNRFWGDLKLSTGVLKTQIAELRQALGDCAKEARFIETVHRRGYRFIGRIQPVQSACRAPPAPPSAPPRVAVAEHFVGREVELEALSRSWLRAQTGDRQIALVSGEAGVGKTALASAFLRQLSDGDGLVLWGQCIDQHGAGAPYLPIIEALRRALGSPSAPQLPESLRRDAPRWLAAMPGLDSAPAGSESGEGALAAWAGRLLREMVEALEAAAQERPLAVLIEDLHWADPSTLDLLSYLAQRVDPARLLLLGTHRPVEASSNRLAETIAGLLSRGRCTVLELPRLSERAVGDYLARRFAGHQLPNALPELILRRTGGNALFMVGLVDGWLERGLLAADGEAWQLRAGLDELAQCVPPSVARMVQAELNRATPLERSVLEAASVAGSEFSTALVASALGLEGAQVEELCSSWARRGQFIEQKGLLSWNDGTLAERCQFLHVSYQQVIYDQLGAARRAQLHLRMAERLEQAYGDEAASVAAELALHFERGRNVLRAVYYLRSAGERALRRSAYREAREHAARALVLARAQSETDERAAVEFALLTLMAAALRISKGHGAAELDGVYARAEELCERQGPAKQALFVMAGRGALQLVRGQYLDALALGQKTLRLAEAAGSATERADAHLLIGGAWHLLGQQRLAEEHLGWIVRLHEADRRLAVSTSSSLDHGFAARGMLAQTQWTLGYVDRARRESERSLERAQAIDHPFAVAQATSCAAAIQLLRREPQAAKGYVDQLERLSRQHGLELFAALAILQRGELQIESGQLQEGIELVRRGLAALHATGTHLYSSYWLCLLARAQGELGQLDAALQILEEGLGGDASQREQLWDAQLVRLRGELLAQRETAAGFPAPGDGEPDAAPERCFEHALEIARQQGAKSLERRAAIRLARYWRARGQAAKGHEVLAPVQAWFSEGLDLPDSIEAQTLLEELAQQR